jgi:ABC-type uncharacterized transport system substrate-binding protein
LLERGRLVLAQRVGCLHSHENADLADLLSRRRRSEQPACRCSADDADEIAPAVEIERSIESFARTPEGGLLIVPDGTIIAHRDLVISLAARFRLPAVYPWRYFVTAGALMSYGIDNIDVLQKAASYVDRILRGAKPVDLPVQAPTEFETAVNLKTAKALGLTR